MENLLLQFLQSLNNPELRLVFDLTAPFYGLFVCLPDTQMIPQREMAIR